MIRWARPGSALRWLTRLGFGAPAVVRTGSLRPADHAWHRRGARFRTPTGRTVRLPGSHCAGAREMFCRNAYLRTGLRIPAGGWVVDLGANAGLFTVLAAVEGARVVAVEAQAGFAPEIERALSYNRVDPDRVRIEVALAGSGAPSVALVGRLAEAQRWRQASHTTLQRPASVCVADLMSRHRIDRIGLLKLDIEGSEFSVLHPDAPLHWLARVDQLAMELHPAYGSVPTVAGLLAREGFQVTVTDDGGAPVPAGSPDAGYLYAHRS